MQQLLAHPAIQAGLAPLLAGALLAVAGHPLRLSGLAPWAGFLAAVYLLGQFALEPLTATRKIVLLAAGAPILGLLADIAFKPTRMTGLVLGALCGLASLWVFWSVLAQKPLAQALLHGTGVVVLLGFTVAAGTALREDPVRAGAAGLGLGLGAGLVALIGASSLIGRYGLALGAASGGFVLALMVLGPRLAAGTAFVLGVTLTAGLLAAGAVFLGKLPWYAAALLALVPLAVWLPVPRNAHAALQALVAALYALATAAGACILAWMALRPAA